MQRFARFNTPHNRRVMDTMHIIPPSHENPMGTSLNYQSKTARTQITKVCLTDLLFLRQFEFK